MEYKVLYRKYRPTDFEEIVGQDYIINILKKSIINNKLAHAYLFSGQRGTGKTTTAKVFAKAINCLNPENGNPCNKCVNCIGFDENPDIIEIDAASNNGVDEIRELKNNVRLVPSNSKYKVYIVDEVHMLSTGAFNALLKTLEEPPDHVIFILATTDPQKIPITVISRCQKFDFHKLNTNIISDYLLKICEKEKIVAELDALNEIAYLADGAMRDALSTLDQILSSINDKLTLSELEKIIKTVSKETLATLYNAIAKCDVELIHQTIISLEKDGFDFSVFVNKFVNFLREKAVLVKKNSISEFEFEKIRSLIFNLNAILYNNKTEISPYLLTEIELLNLLENKINSAATDVVELKAAKEENLKITSENLMEATTKEETKIKPTTTINKLKKIRVNNCFVDANKESLNNAKINWKKFILYEAENNLKVYNFILNAQVVASSNKYMIFEFKNESEASLFNKNKIAIEKEYKEFQINKFLIIGLSKEEWLKYRNKYIEDKKNNIIYVIKKEKKTKKKNLAETKIGKVAYKIFDEKNIKAE